MTTNEVISSVRRDLRIGLWLQRALLFGAGFGIVAAVLGLGWGRAVAAGLMAAWIGLLLWSVRGGRIAGETARLISVGRHDEAEEHVEDAARRFGVLRPIKLATLHQLAVLRHAQGRYAESQRASESLLDAAGPRPAAAPARLLLADAALEAGDLDAARRALEALRNQPLPAGAAATLMLAQLEYQGRVGAWEAITWRLRPKLELAGLLPARQQALASALLALAHRELGYDVAARELADRAGLLADPAALLDRRPHLATLWPDLDPDPGGADDVQALPGAPAGRQEERPS